MTRLPTRDEAIRYGAMAAMTGAVGMTAGSTVVASMLDHHALLGGPLFVYQGISVHAPWDLAVWTYKWGSRVPELTWGWLSSAVPFLYIGWIVQAQRKSAPAGKPKSISENDGWGTEEELRRAGLLNGSGFGKLGGIILGMLPNSKLVSYDGKEHGIVSGTSGCGKTMAKVVPDILSWLGSVVVSDPKREIYAMCGDYRATLGPCFFVDPTHPDSARINPLVSEVRWGTHNERADVKTLCKILSKSRGKPLKTDAAIHYEGHALELLAAIAICFKHDLGGMYLSFGGILRRLSVFTTEVLPELLKSSQEFVRRAAVNLSAEGPANIAKIVPVVAEILEVFDDDMVYAMTSGESDFRCGDVFASDKPMSIFLQIRKSEAERLAPFVSLIEALFVQCSLYDERALPDGRRKKQDLLLVCEEFPAQGEKKIIADNLLILRSYKVTVLIVTQSIRALERVYGQFQTIFGMCKWAILYASLDEHEQQVISRNCGTKYVVEESVKRDRTLFQKPLDGSVSTKVVSKPVIDAAGVRALSDDKQIVLMLGQEHAFQLTKPVWFQHPWLKTMAHNLHECEGALQSEYILAKHHARVTP